MRTFSLGQLTSKEREWLALQTRLLRDGVAADVDSGVLERQRAGGLASVVLSSLVIGVGALALVGWSLLQLNRSAHAMNPVMVIVLGAAVAAGLIAFCWRGAVTLAAARLPYLPMWIVTTEHLIQVSGAGVTVWPVRDVARIDVRMYRGGVSIKGAYEDGRRFHVNFGVAICGGLSWPEGSSIARAIQMVGGVPATDAMSGLFAGGARGHGTLRRRAIVAGAVAFFCIGGSLAYHGTRASEVRALMKSGALSSPYKESAASAAKAVSGARASASVEPETRHPDETTPVAAAGGEVADGAPSSTRAKPASKKATRRAGSRAKARRAGGREAKPAIRPSSPGVRRIAGGLPRQLISQVVGRKRGAIGACYRKGLASNPGLKGRVLVKLVIGSSGVVTSATDAGSSLPDRRVVACIVGQMRTLAFPAPQGGNATVVYPFDLGP
jgi:hypothetical protein